MYSPTKSLVLRLFKVDGAPPEPPRGAHDRVRVLRASPKYFTYSVLALLCAFAVLGGLLVVGCIAALFSSEPWAAAIPSGLLALVLALFSVLFFCARVDYELRYYVLTDKSVRVRHGAWIVDEKTITYSNVQNVRIVQGPLQRMFGISDVRLDTAGGGASVEAQKHGNTGHGVALAGIENAAEVRDEILGHLRRRAGGAGLGDADDERGPRRELSSRALATLREVVDEARALRRAAEERHGGAP
ncbi:MAG: PH domain-containing protein [Planctomycetes bacterium]|nr:PH domain-containing protein [Planctomycetota bacterium]